MNPFWLILIIPLSMTAGAFCMALVAVKHKGGEHEEV